MMEEWENKGHSTAGFDLGHEMISGAEDGPGQSRSIWPETADIYQERAQRNFRVSIPDIRGKKVLCFTPFCRIGFSGGLTCHFPLQHVINGPILDILKTRLISSCGFELWPL